MKIACWSRVVTEVRRKEALQRGDLSFAINGIDLLLTLNGNRIQHPSKKSLQKSRYMFLLKFGFAEEQMQIVGKGQDMQSKKNYLFYLNYCFS